MKQLGRALRPPVERLGPRRVVEGAAASVLGVDEGEDRELRVRAEADLDLLAGGRPHVGALRMPTGLKFMMKSYNLLRYLWICPREWVSPPARVGFVFCRAALGVAASGCRCCPFKLV